MTPSHPAQLISTPALSYYDPDVLLYPTLDLLNHSPHTQNFWITDANSLSIICEDVVQPGDEIFNCYGARNNGQLLLSYGFALENNPHDAFPLKLPMQTYPLLDKLEAQGAVFRAEGAQREPSRIPEAHDPSKTTFYVRVPEGNGAQPGAPGYPSGVDGKATWPAVLTMALAGMPLALVARLTSLLLDER